jgi:hypothetical protein
MLQAPLMPDFGIRAELDARIREPRPVVRELERLERAAVQCAADARLVGELAFGDVQ